MQYINEEIIRMINAAFPENVHLGRFVVDDKVIYGFDRVAAASLSNLVEILVFDVKEFTFRFNEDNFFNQTPDTIIPQLIGKFTPEDISKIVSEFLLRRDEYLLLKDKCSGVSGKDLFDAIDDLKPRLKEIYKNDPFNPLILEKKIEQAREDLIKQGQIPSQEQQPQEPEVDWIPGIADTLSMLSVVLIYILLDMSKGLAFLVMSLLFLQTARCFPFIVNLLKWLKFKQSQNGKQKRNTSV